MNRRVRNLTTKAARMRDENIHHVVPDRLTGFTNSPTSNNGHIYNLFLLPGETSKKTQGSALGSCWLWCHLSVMWVVMLSVEWCELLNRLVLVGSLCRTEAAPPSLYFLNSLMINVWMDRPFLSFSQLYLTPSLLFFSWKSQWKETNNVPHVISSTFYLIDNTFYGPETNKPSPYKGRFLVLAFGVALIHIVLTH